MSRLLPFTAKDANEAIKSNLGLKGIVEKLKKQAGQKLDTIVPGKDLRLFIHNGSPLLSYQSPKMGEMAVMLGERFHQQAAAKLDIPIKYYRKMLAKEPALLQQSVNTWLKASDSDYMVRTLCPGRSSNGPSGGTARAFLSSSYEVSYDSLNMLTGLLDALKLLTQSGEMPNIEFTQCYLTDDRMIVKITAPEIKAQAPELLKNYRRPDGREVHGDDQYGVMAGLRISNSETGQASFQISPSIIVSQCENKMIYSNLGVKRKHVGSKLTPGVEYSSDTLAARHEWMKGETRDTVRTFLSPRWLSGKVEDLERLNIHLDHPVSAAKNVASHLGYSEALTDQLVDFFVAGKDHTAFGITQAITWQAQYGGNVGKTGKVSEFSADKEFEMEDAKFCLSFLKKAKSFDFVPA